MQTIRAHAEEWHIDPNQIGIMGFSAGGHLAASASTLLDEKDRPNFTILFYPVLKELDSATVKGAGCRVVLLEAPDKSEQAKVYIASRYCFPLKAEFFKAGEKEPYRTLEVNSFRQSNDLYYTDEISLYGPGWRTRINFDKSADVGPYDAAKPPAIIRKL